MEGLQGNAKHVMNRIDSNLSISEANKKHIIDLVTYLQARGAKPNTIDKYVYHYEKIINLIGHEKDILKAKRPELETALARLNGLKLSEEEKRKVKVTIKAIYKHFLGEDLYYPKQIAWIKTSGSKNKMLPQDLLTEEDVLKLIHFAKDLRDKALIALLFDTGMRIGELSGLKVKDIDTGSSVAHVTVNGKTGMRRIPITFSVPYVTQYINTLNNVKPNSPLWLATGTWENTGRSIDQNGIRLMLKRLSKKAGINKRIYPHLFRHSRASIYANKLTEQQLKVYFGWTGDSKMAATYVHLSGRDIDNAIIQAYGGKPDVAAEEVKLKVKICARCQFDNPVDAKYCNRCGSPLDISTAVLEERTSIEIRNSLMESIKDPKLLEEIVHQYLLEKKKGGNR
ncbi:tyrosine-type recombinase/integrase [Candidatus Marsarchaeota archaeon]|jgi:site-specific recombinase XerD|nr:tyrosine-type recombinase/integrase [Candidatus Marsarchaeota archaeon]